VRREFDFLWQSRLLAVFTVKLACLYSGNDSIDRWAKGTSMGHNMNLSATCCIFDLARVVDLIAP